METVCFCCSNSNSETTPTSTTPLLKGSMPQQPVTSEPTSTARQYRPKHDDVSEKTQKVAMSVVDIPVLDKMFKDHSTRYNSIHAKYLTLKQNLHRFKEKFESETAGVPTIDNCVPLMVAKCGNAKLQVNRTSQYLIQLDFNRKEISAEAPTCPEELLQTLDLFNQSNKLMKTIITQSPEVKGSVERSIEMEREFVKDVMKAGLEPSDEMLAMKHYNENIAKIRKIPAYLDVIYPEVSELFKRMLKATTSALA